MKTSNHPLLNNSTVKSYMVEHNMSKQTAYALLSAYANKSNDGAATAKTIAKALGIRVTARVSYAEFTHNGYTVTWNYSDPNCVALHIWEQENYNKQLLIDLVNQQLAA